MLPAWIEAKAINRNWSPLRNWSLGFLGTAIAVTVCYLWLDRPIAHFAHDELQQFHLFEKLPLIPEVLTPLAVLAFTLLGLRALIGAPLSRFQTVFMLSGISLAVAVIIKDELKYVFGRTGPETWIHNNPSFIRDDVFGFFPFHGGPGYASFPSGHATAICAVITVFWICYPRFRPLYALCVAAVAVGLVGENFHFLSDVIAGGFLGISAGWLGVALWERGQAHVIDAQGRLFADSDAGLVASHPDMTRLVQVETARAAGAGGGPVPGKDILGRDVLVELPFEEANAPAQ